MPAQRMAERERPDEPAVMFQRWENLLFVHWRWDPVKIQNILPQGLTVDTYHGGAWLGVTPLFLRNVRPRFLPAVPFVSEYLEVDVRTYVYDSLGRPGVYFLSLDCDQPLVVATARRLFNLNYEHAAMRGHVDDAGWTELASQRAGREAYDLFRYKPASEAEDAEASSLEFFLLERYRIFAADAAGGLWSARLSHAAHRVRKVDVVVGNPAVLRLAGFDPQSRPPDHVCMVDPLDVELHAPEPVPDVERRGAESAGVTKSG